MTIAELPDRWTVEEAGEDHECGPGLLITDTRFDTLHHVTVEAFAGLTLPQLAAVTARGRDVDHVTRVTGYFSRTSGWNKGKTQELKDRHKGAI